MKKKAQIQIMETIAILLIFFVLVVIGFVFFMRTASYGHEQEITKNQELESIRVSQTVSSLPELQCSSKNIIEENCFDELKLDAFKDLENKEQMYYPFFYNSKIIVRDYSEESTSWILYDKTTEGSSYKTIMPILIKNPQNRNYAFGILDVTYYTPI